MEGSSRWYDMYERSTVVCKVVLGGMICVREVMKNGK